ncbi:MAG: bifunctional oligoribonuclease/PAP phosphatase NrnA [Bacteroides sp.]|nr:bifunctional oligoribonuclease/PAP phosphatase NrnA [Bacteroides sp.]MCM1095196.1 bifunctional oligoribonuclease/PAP phosphatase NrnA [Terasakiella sp.]
MISQPIDKSTLEALRAALDDAERIVILTHMSPDGDAIGSSTAMQRLLLALGKEARIVIPDILPGQLRRVPGAKEAVDATRYPDFARQLIDGADLLLCFDLNEPGRIGRLATALTEATATKVLIDHHLHPADFADVVISHPELSSTCYLLFKVLCGLELFGLIDNKIAESILTGMMTDTGNFSYNASDPELYLVVAELMRKGADKERIYREQFETHSLDSMRLNAYAISERMEVWPDCGAALITLTRDELNRFHYAKGDTEGLVNRPLAVPGVVYSAFLREEDDFVKVSMRSVGDFPVNILCREHFGGGGHLNAAGGEFRGTLAEAADLFRSLLKTNKEKYIH